MIRNSSHALLDGPEAIATVAESERVSAETAESHNAFLSDWLDESPVATLLLDSNFRVVWVNRTLERYFGLGRAELLGKDKRKLIRKKIQNLFEDPERFAQTVLATFDKNVDFTTFHCHLLRKGSRKERWLMHWSRPIRRGPLAGGRVEHYTDVTGCKRLEDELLRKSRTLSERVKELSCLLEISGITESPDVSFKEAMQAILDRIPPAWQFPEVTCARLTLGGRPFQTENFRETAWKQTEEVSVNGRREGTLEVYLLEDLSAADGDRFLKEEMNLLHAIALKIGRLAERHEAEQALRRRGAELEDLNAALRVLMKQTDQEKRSLEERILYSVEELVLPYLDRLKQGRLQPRQRTNLNVADSNLRDIVSPFTRRLIAKYARLSNAEIEVASYIRAGNTTQQIADTLHRSPRTVEFHRQNIRRKLGLNDRKANLRSHLLSVDS